MSPNDVEKINKSSGDELSVDSPILLDIIFKFSVQGRRHERQTVLNIDKSFFLTENGINNTRQPRRQG